MLAKLFWKTERPPTLSHKNCSLRSTSSDCLTRVTSPGVWRCVRLLSYISRSYVMLSYVSKHCFSSQASHHTDHTDAVSPQKCESCAVLKRKQLPDQKEKVKADCTCQVRVWGAGLYSDLAFKENKNTQHTNRICTWNFWVCHACTGHRIIILAVTVKKKEWKTFHSGAIVINA